MQSLPLGELGATPWSFSPLWFVAMAIALPALVWLGLAWRRALLACPNRVRRAGVKEMRRLLKAVQRSDAPPRPAHLHAWLRATARVWDVRTSAPCVSEVSQAAQALTGDSGVSSRWQELWQTTEHGLYAANAQPPADWVQRAANAATTVEMPKRQSVFPNRLAHWVPSVASVVLIVTLLVPKTFADVPWSAPPTDTTDAQPTASEPMTEPPADVSTADAVAEAAPPEPLSPEVQQAALTALKANWNDWAAHHNLAAYLTQEGASHSAIAHATAAFVQHPSSNATRATLLAALGETQIIDEHLRRLLSGTWYERAPTLLSPAGWQRLGLVAGLIAATGFTLLVLTMYFSPGSASPSQASSAQVSLGQISLGRARLPRPALLWAGRGAAAFGVLLLVASITSWHSYGTLNQPNAAILLQDANASPVPTDLVPNEETSPLSAGAVVRTGRTFLSWREVRGSREISGWVRGNAVMPIYTSR
jgi:hypothetical protein